MHPRHRLIRLAVWLVSIVLSPATFAADPPADPIRYTLRFPSPQSHYAEVEATIPTLGVADLELYMAVWTPGSYLVREYARNLENVAAKTLEGKPLTIEKVKKNRWKLTTGGAPSVIVSYRVYCREMGVQTSWIDSGFALINGAGTYLTLADKKPRPHEMSLVPPPGWLRTITGLPASPDGQPHHYVAADFDTLLDCPIYAGNPNVYEFVVEGKVHYLVNEGENGVWDGPRSARDTESIVKAARALWGQLPYDKYIFFNLLTESGGGLEHKNSTVLMSSRWNTKTRPAYLGWLDLVSHEFFHAWQFPIKYHLTSWLIMRETGLSWDDKEKPTGSFYISFAANFRIARFRWAGEGTKKTPFYIDIPLFYVVFMRITIIMPDEYLPPEKRQNAKP
jgi:hypothetical protein